MFKQANTHRVKSPSIFNRMKAQQGTLLTTSSGPEYTANGLSLTNDNQGRFTVPNPERIFKQGGDFTIEFVAEFNATNTAASTTWYLWGLGNQGDNSNCILLRMTSGNLLLYIFDNTSTYRVWTLTTPGVGNHTVSISYTRSSHSATCVFNGVQATFNGAGSGVALTPETQSRYWIGCNPRASTFNTEIWNGSIARFHYSPHARSVADMIKRHDAKDLFPIDKYTAVDWDYRNGLEAVWCNYSGSRKYV